MIRCWPNGSRGKDRDCDETLPDGDFDTMERYGWGWVYAPDDGSPIGTGAFYACPYHRTDCTKEERTLAIAKLRRHRGGEG